MHGDLGQAWLALEDIGKAEPEIEESLALARRNGDPRFEFLALKDRASARLAQNRSEEAEADLNAAEQLSPGGDPSLRLILATVRGKLLAARGDPQALVALEQAVRGFADLKLPDLEIPARIALAEALVQAKYKAQAEQCLLAGLKLARGDGYARYLSPLNEAMARLDIVEGCLTKRDAPSPRSPAQNRPQAAISFGAARRRRVRRSVPRVRPAAQLRSCAEMFALGSAL